MGRRVKVKVHEIERLARLQCTEREAAGALRINVRTFRKLLAQDERAARAWEQGQQEGKISLRRKQLRLAGSQSAMAIWLGKQMLDQKDVVINEHSGRDGKPIETLDLSGLNAKERAQLRGLITKVQPPADT